MSIAPTAYMLMLAREHGVHRLGTGLVTNGLAPSPAIVTFLVTKTQSESAYEEETADYSQK